MLSVIDTGHGMDEETRAHIFEPFFTTKALGKGTGLGLARYTASSSRAAGEIAVASDLGEETRIQVYMPRIFGIVSADEPREKEGTWAGTETVLLVEDEDEVRRLVQEVLEQHGFRVLPAAQPQEAMEICQKLPRAYRTASDRHGDAGDGRAATGRGAGGSGRI